ncbi:MAG: hypothetical protein AB7E32_11780 [Desulfovibrio sp.]
MPELNEEILRNDPQRRVSPLFFDQRDYSLLSIVNDVLERDEPHWGLKKLLAPYLHPHGIKEMAATRGLRVAYAVIHLLGSLERGKANERVEALRAVRDEVLTTAKGSLRTNAARVLLQIMKELVRSKGDFRKQLELAHDFRIVTSGKPRVVLQQLHKYHLVEMPEEWNQISFDDHVHDANSKGRKSPTHLIMDAWIKGIRRLTVVYYNYVDPRVAEELLHAAEVMEISVHVGVDVSARYRDRFARFVWEPRGFADPQEYLGFLRRADVQEFMSAGRKASNYQHAYVFEVMRAYNQRHRLDLGRSLDIEAPLVDEVEFCGFVGMGQPSLLHLGTHILEKLMPLLRERHDKLCACLADGNGGNAEEQHALLERMSRLCAEEIVEQYLIPERNPDLSDPGDPDASDLPELMALTPPKLMQRFAGLHSLNRVTLIPDGLGTDQVLEILFDCRSYITHMEIFNLKGDVDSRSAQSVELNRVRLALNDSSPIALKRILRERIGQLEQGGIEGNDLLDKLNRIIGNINGFRSPYRTTPLKASMGSRSTGRSVLTRGMGLVVAETLPPRSRRHLAKADKREFLPVTVEAWRRVTCIPHEAAGRLGEKWYALLRSVSWLSGLACRKVSDWKPVRWTVSMEAQGNVATLGGPRKEPDSGLKMSCEQKCKKSRLKFRHLNSRWLNLLKVTVGFIPAFLTFALTKDWWVLAYLGAFIWFGITGVRNVIQSVLGGGGVRRSPLLRWNDYVSWSRICDSLLYTGFSVPLLDWLTKSVVLDHMFGINTSTNPLLLYTIMALTNGVYITSHNLFRGLPHSAAFGNFFRSVLSIPIAVLFNSLVGLGLALWGVPDVNGVLQRWAAVISKLASDCVAGFIEGLADRRSNIEMRRWDYKAKLAQVFECYSALELLFPRKDVLQMLRRPEEFFGEVRTARSSLDKVMMVNALDLLYLYMYQPRAASALRGLVATMSREEREVFLVSQSILENERDVSRLFVDGIVGRNFSKGLSFYLLRYKGYLRGLDRLVQSLDRNQGKGSGRALASRIPAS